MLSPLRDTPFHSKDEMGCSKSTPPFFKSSFQVSLNLKLKLCFKSFLFLDFRYTEDVPDSPLSEPHTGINSVEEQPQIPKKVVRLNFLFQKKLCKFEVLC